MSKLTELHIELKDGNRLATKLRAAFKRVKPSFLSVKTLNVNCTYDMEFLIAACVNLENLILIVDSKWRKNLTAAKQAPKLRYLELKRRSAWRPKHVEDLHEFLTNVPSLCLKGELFETKVSHFAPGFSLLPNLEHLAITDTQWVDVDALAEMYADDHLLNVADDLRANHTCNEDRLGAAHRYFSLCRKLKHVRFMHLYGCDSEKFEVDRGDEIKTTAVGPKERHAKLDRHAKWFGMPTAFQHW